MLPMTPHFAEFILQTPEDERRGHVFKMLGTYTGQQITAKRVCRIISEIGKAAGVVVNKADGKFATARDLRRSFGTRWTKRVRSAVLQKLMRHKEISTTMAYYVDLDADEIGDCAKKLGGGG